MIGSIRKMYVTLVIMKSIETIEPQEQTCSQVKENPNHTISIHKSWMPMMD